MVTVEDIKHYITKKFSLLEPADCVDLRSYLDFAYPDMFYVTTIPRDSRCWVVPRTEEAARFLLTTEQHIE